MRSAFSLAIVLAAPFLAAPSLLSAQDSPPFVSADPAVVDADFPFQGEYTGLILPDEGNCTCNTFRRVGLQVVALGSGKFDAVYYDFGLPGAGWNGTERRRLSGQRVGDIANLTGDGLTARIEGNQVVLSSERGHTLGGFRRVVRTSPTLGKRPPSNAIVLFDGSSADEFYNGKISDDGLLMEGADFKRMFTDFTMHLEFRLPYMPSARGQKRGNSGVYLQSRYEVQVLDSFGLDGKFNECGALYRYQPPNVNMCLPPLQWQTYDITFLSPRFTSEDEKTGNARLTVRHNGVLVHNCFNVERKTGAGRPESSDPYPIRLQNHSDPVRFQNIWVIDHSPVRPDRSRRVALK